MMSIANGVSLAAIGWGRLFQETGSQLPGEIQTPGATPATTPPAADAAATASNAVNQAANAAVETTQLVQKTFFEQIIEFGYMILPLVILCVTVILCWMIGRAIANSLRLPDYATRLTVILLAISLGCIVGLTNWPPRWGVDLRGGINLVGQLNMEQNESEIGGGLKMKAVDVVPILLRRVDPSGVKEIVIRPLGDDKIEVIIPDVDGVEADEIWNRLVKTGHLQFRIVCEERYHSTIMRLAREQANRGETARGVYETDSSGNRQLVARWYNLARVETLDGRADARTPVKEVPMLGNLVRDRQTGKLIDVSLFRGSGDGEQFGQQFANWLADQGIKSPQILMVEPTTETWDVEGKHLKNVRADFDEKGRPCIAFDMTTDGSKRMRTLTNKHKPNATGKYRLGVILDDSLISAPEIMDVISGRGRIMGNFQKKEVDEMIVNLKSGKIEVALYKNPISKQFQLSTLGEELKQKGFLAIFGSLGIVLLFMLFYYRAFAGGVSCIALLVNMLLTLAFVMAIKQPLTLTGLAGLVLTIGMAVDANVLIFERIREELTKGAALRMAIRNGFDKATTTIIDSNVTTLLTAVVLYVIGTEQIKGFSVTLTLGILLSMFTAIYCSRTFFEIAERKRWITSLSMMQMYRGGVINFLRVQRPAILVSLVVIAIGMVSMFSLGSRILDIDLRGGSTARIVFNESISIDEVRSELNKQAYEVRGSKVEFAVSQFSDPEFKERVFKIDSNVPSYDESQGEPWKQLDEILTEVFGDRLKKHHLDFKRSAPSNSQWSPQSPNSQTVVSANRKVFDPFNGLAPELPAIGNSSRLGWHPVETRQETETGSQSGSGQSGDPQSTTPPKTAEQATEQGVGAASSELNTAGQIGAENPAGNQDGDNPAATTPAPVRGRFEFDLTFQDEVSGRSIVTQLVEASARLDLPVEEETVLIKSDNPDPDEDPFQALSKNWTLSFEANRAEDAEKVISAWAGELNTKVFFPTISGVGGQVAQDAQWQALAAIFASLVGIIIYIWIRFQNIAYGLAAVVALVHDVLMVLGAIALSHYLAAPLGFLQVVEFKISLSVLAAILTVIGYSLNDTIVIFDRIREQRGKRVELTAEMINTSVSQTLSRTILTALTTLLVVVVLYFFGGDSIHGFAFALVVGVVVGTYSSVFIAAPVLYYLMNRAGLNENLAAAKASNG